MLCYNILIYNSLKRELTDFVSYYQSVSQNMALFLTIFQQIPQIPNTMTHVLLRV